jgi:CheY-like chemotaxis protein
VTPTDPQRTVLVADDQAGQRAVIDMLLSLDGLTTVTVSDGREALDWLKAHTPDLAVLDIKMPHVDGLDVCYRMKSIRRLQAVPVVILTAMRDEATLENARAVGADAIVHKPLEGKDFRATIGRFLSGVGDPD